MKAAMMIQIMSKKTHIKSGNRTNGYVSAADTSMSSTPTSTANCVQSSKDKKITWSD